MPCRNTALLLSHFSRPWSSTSVAFLIGRSSRQFNLTVAAETLVAFGVLSLVIGLGTAILLAVNRFQAANTIAMEDLKAVTTVFIEGLLTAAVCPMLAMLIRIREAQLRIVEAAGPEMDSAGAGGGHAHRPIEIRDHKSRGP